MFGKLRKKLFTCTQYVIIRAGRYWNLLPLYIMAKSIMVLRYFIFSQPETNYTIEGIILVHTLIVTDCISIYSDF